MKLSALILLIVTLLFTVGCYRQSEQPEPERTHRFEVSVKTGGEAVKDFNTSLVHRIILNKDEFNALLLRTRNKQNVTFVFSPDRDSKGGVKGLKVSRAEQRYATMLGFGQGDLITAVGKAQMKNQDPLRVLLNDFQATKKATLTLERNGKPHKILYYLEGAEPPTDENS